MYLRYPTAPYRWLLPGGITWHLPEGGARAVALSFDDGPDPDVTPAVLDILAASGVRATFFCLGERLKAHPGLMGRMRSEGHVVANHGFRHMDGWRSPGASYLENVGLGAEASGSRLFRPPYGRIRPAQALSILEENSIVMWSLLSGDFDTRRSAGSCLNDLQRHTKAGDIVVFHDTRAAAPVLLSVLPRYIKFLQENSYLFEIL